MTHSRIFGNRNPKRSHLVRRGGGLRGEVAELRDDVDDALAALEQTGVLGDAVALSQADFYCDFINGDDHNDGASATDLGGGKGPLKTLREYTKRIGIGVVPGIQNLHILADEDVGLDGLILRGAYRGGLYITGVRTVKRSGTITSVPTEWDYSTFTAGTITDTGVASWVADEGDMIVLTSGAEVDAVAWIAADTGAGSDTCRHSHFFDEDGFSQVDSPPSGSTYDIVTLSKISGAIVFAHSGWISLHDVEVFDDGSAFGSYVQESGQVNVGFCKFTDPYGSSIGSGSFLHGAFAACYFSCSSMKFSVSFCFLSFCLLQKQIVVDAGSNVEIYSCVWQGSEAVRILPGGHVGVNAADYVAIYDCVPASSRLFELRVGAKTTIAGTVFGTGNDGAGTIGLHLDSGAHAYFFGTFSNLLDLQGTSLTEINLAGDVTLTYATVPAGGTGGSNAVRGALIVPATGGG